MQLVLVQNTHKLERIHILLGILFSSRLVFIFILPAMALVISIVSRVDSQPEPARTSWPAPACKTVEGSILQTHHLLLDDPDHIDPLLGAEIGKLPIAAVHQVPAQGLLPPPATFFLISDQGDWELCFGAFWTLHVYNYYPLGKVSPQFVPSYALIWIEWSDNGGEDASEVDLVAIRFKSCSSRFSLDGDDPDTHWRGMTNTNNLGWAVHLAKYWKRAMQTRDHWNHFGRYMITLSLETHSDLVQMEEDVCLPV